MRTTIALFFILLMFPSAALAGNAQVIVGGGRGFSGDGGPALKAKIHGATTLVSNRKGGYYFTDSWNHRIREIEASGRIRTVIGSGKSDWCGDNRKARDICLALPHGISLDPSGRLIVTDTFHNRILRLDYDGIVRTIAGSGESCEPGQTRLCGEGRSALRAKLYLPTIARYIGSELYISDSANRILAVKRGKMVRVAGTGDQGFSGDGGPATEARLWAPADMIAYKGGLLISDGNNCRLRFVNRSGIISTFAGGGSLEECWRAYGAVPPERWYTGWGSPLPADQVGDGGPATAGRILVAGFLATDGTTVWVTDFLNNRVRQIRNGKITTIVGTGEPLGTNGNGPTPGTRFRLGWPSCVTRVGSRLIITDAGNDRIVSYRLP